MLGGLDQTVLMKNICYAAHWNGDFAALGFLRYRWKNQKIIKKKKKKKDEMFDRFSNVKYNARLIFRVGLNCYLC